MTVVNSRRLHSLLAMSTYLLHVPQLHVSHPRFASLVLSEIPFDPWPLYAAGRAVSAEAVAGAAGADAGGAAVAAAGLQARLGGCAAGTGAVSAPRILALLLERLGADSQVRIRFKRNKKQRRQILESDRWLLWGV